MPLAFLSFISVIALGTYILWKLGFKPPKSTFCVKYEPQEASSDEAENKNNSTLIEPQPVNGTIFVIPETACVAPLTVEVTGSGSYFIYLKFLRYPENVVFTDLSSTGADRSDVGFFVAADSKVSLSVPAGVYRLTYASGKDWRGIQEKFGPDTKYYEANRTLTFYQENNRLYGNTIQLFPQSDGNASFHQLNPSDFPG